MIHDEIVLRGPRGTLTRRQRAAHDCVTKSLTEERDLGYDDVGTIVACPECGKRWKVVASLRLDFKRRPSWERRRLPWPKVSSPDESRATDTDPSGRTGPVEDVPQSKEKA